MNDKQEKVCWIVELMTDNHCNIIDIYAIEIEKINFTLLIVDDIAWELPDYLNMSFAEVRKDDE